tara:strand:- start:3487 stop:4584 length:1098 start_codon:yes stop_codon:yes gene_type:complete
MVTISPLLTAGLDFRLPEYRSEVFQRFYTFHLKYQSHPGCVYYLMPYLAETEGWSPEQRLWFAFLNGNTQNPVTSYIIFHKFPDFENLDIVALADWFNDPRIYQNLAWDTDRRHHKVMFIRAVDSYQSNLYGKTQWEFFSDLCTHDEYSNFRRVWDFVSERFLSFGRLSTFSYLEYLRIMGADLDCDQLFLEDREGSRSHRNGICKVIGRDDLDWHSSNPGFDGRYSPDLIKQLENAGETLLADAKVRNEGMPWANDVSYFTLESALCTYKSWHRKNRRYPNVYNDLLFNRIEHAEARWIRPKLDIFWDARQLLLPPNLLMEENPLDVGCVPLKQNHYLSTGEVIMMERDWKCFDNEYARARISA